MEADGMPKLLVESNEVLESLKGGPSKGYKEREELRVALAALLPDQIIRLTPDDGESMRKLKRMVTEAGKDIDRTVKHVEAPDGDLLVFIPAPKPEGAPQRGRPRKKVEEES
jgi:hypothetical protein